MPVYATLPNIFDQARYLVQQGKVLQQGTSARYLSNVSQQRIGYTMPMHGHLLATKLYVPPPPQRLVARARLLKQLDEGLQGKLVLISTPPGFGKTTLVSNWIATQDLPAAWLSLDTEDANPRRFLTYLVAALQNALPAVGASVSSALDSAQMPPADSILTALLNEIAATGRAFVLVLDDYHVIDSNEIDRLIAFLVDHMPPVMHLIMTTREDPQLPLARWRARAQLVEVRAADLSFTPAEAALFLNQGTGLDLTSEEIAALEARTEGWVAGLQMALLSLRGRTDVAAFIQNFAGDNRHVVDYLVEEVLQRQSADMRAFLLQTSILDRLCAPLCNAVTGLGNGAIMLESLERNNLFLVPLDDKRHWYRYHHLFAAVLAARATHEAPAEVTQWHARASDWYAAHAMPADAIRHAFAAQDYARAATLIQGTLFELRRARNEGLLIDWVRALPKETVRSHPLLGVHYAGALMQRGRIDEVDDLLSDAESHLGASPASKMDAAEMRLLPGWIAIYRAGLALITGATHTCLEYAQRALDELPADAPMERGAAAALCGIAWWSRGNLDQAYETYAAGMEQVERAGFFADSVGSAIILADLSIAQGRLQDASATYERGFALAVAQSEPPLRGAADMLVGMSMLYFEWNRLEDSLQALQRARSLGDFAGLPQSAYRWRVAMAQLRFAEGDLNGALLLLQDAERLYVGDFTPNVRPLSTRKVRVWLAQGRTNDCLAWVRTRRLAPNEELAYLNECEYLTLARILLAQEEIERASLDTAGSHATAGSLDTAASVRLLERLLAAARAGERMGSIIEISVVLALAYQAYGATDAALATLEHAMLLAQPQGYLRLFVDEGAAMGSLLRHAIARHIQPEYAHQILAAFPAPQVEVAPLRHSAPARQALVEPLSQREIDVLRLFPSELSGPQIADQLIIALSTLRTHTKNIYGKLGVSSRRAAVNRALELGLI